MIPCPSSWPGRDGRGSSLAKGVLEQVEVVEVDYVVVGEVGAWVVARVAHRLAESQLQDVEVAGVDRVVVVAVARAQKAHFDACGRPARQRDVAGGGKVFRPLGPPVVGPGR